MKDFFYGIFIILQTFIMWTPLHFIRLIWIKVVLKNIGKHSSISRNVEIRSPWRVSIGSFSSINKKTLLDGRGGNLIIGSCVDIAQECNIWTLQHNYNSPKYEAIGKDTVIDDYVWIASRVTILPGIKVGYGAVVASGAVVTKDVPPLAIVGGIPAKIIGHRNSKSLQYKLGHRKWFE